VTSRVIFFVVLFFYVFTGALGMGGNGYIEIEGEKRIVKANWMILFSLGTGVFFLFYTHYKKLFQDSYKKISRAWQIFLPVVGIFLSVAVMVGIALFVNSSIGHRPSFLIKGIIERKWQTHSRKSSSYFIAVKDTASGKSYEFKVYKSFYDIIGERGAGFSKVFDKGSLGVIYRHEY
jgi:hypothetical protein